MRAFFGIPWRLLRCHRNWAVGDAFSGQFRLASAVLPPRSLTLIDDGSGAMALVDALVGRTSYACPHQRESVALGALGILARERMLALAARDRLEISTAFEFGTVRTSLLSDQSIPVTSHRFDWLRRTARPIRVPGNRVLLGSALPTDGRMSMDRYLHWVQAEAADAPVVFLPHRRETETALVRIRAIAGLQIFDCGLPVELVLAGTQEPLEVITLPTSARTTLTHILAGTGSSIRTRSLHRESIR